MRLADGRDGHVGLLIEYWGSGASHVNCDVPSFEWNADALKSLIYERIKRFREVLDPAMPASVKWNAVGIE